MNDNKLTEDDKQIKLEEQSDLGSLYEEEYPDLGPYGPNQGSDFGGEEIEACSSCGGPCDMNTEYEGSAVCQNKNCEVHKL